MKVIRMNPNKIVREIERLSNRKSQIVERISALTDEQKIVEERLSALKKLQKRYEDLSKEVDYFFKDDDQKMDKSEA